jgi:hypothetical protein
MPQYVIQRNIPGIDRMTPGELKAAARKSNRVLADLGSEIQWLHSYVVSDRLYCVYVSPDMDLIREHARLTGFPATEIFEVAQVIDPESGN